ncbi:MAG: LysR family transcriptional regulator [Oscillospiraceae bacterium]|jgi:DNA-binding transcriptional LysR family regulator
MNDLSIVCFLSVARTLNFALTAEELYTTQQAVSRNIQNLEKELGFTLFHRHYHTVRLTHAGEEFYKAFSEYSQSLATYSRIVEDDASIETLRIGWTKWSGLPPELSLKMKGFVKQYPNTIKIRTLEISDCAVYESLRTGEVEVAIIPRYLAGNFDDDFIVLPVAEIPLYIVIESDHPLITLPSIANVLLTLTHITSYAGEPDENAVKQRVYREYERLDYFPKSVDVLPNLESVFTEVLMGNGVTFSPANRFSECDNLAMLPLPRTATISTVRLRRNEDKHVLAFEKYLMDKRVDIE